MACCVLSASIRTIMHTKLSELVKLSKWKYTSECLLFLIDRENVLFVAVFLFHFPFSFLFFFLFCLFCFCLLLFCFFWFGWSCARMCVLFVLILPFSFNISTNKRHKFKLYRIIDKTLLIRNRDHPAVSIFLFRQLQIYCKLLKRMWTNDFLFIFICILYGKYVHRSFSNPIERNVYRYAIYRYIYVCTNRLLFFIHFVFFFFLEIKQSNIPFVSINKTMCSTMFSNYPALETL